MGSSFTSRQSSWSLTMTIRWGRTWWRRWMRESPWSWLCKPLSKIQMWESGTSQLLWRCRRQRRAWRRSEQGMKTNSGREEDLTLLTRRARENPNRRERANTRVSSCTLQLQTADNFALHGITRLRAARAHAIVCTPVAFVSLRLTLPSSTRMTTTQVISLTRVAPEILDKRRKGRCTGSSTCSVAKEGSTTLPVFCMSGPKGAQNLRSWWKSGTSRMGRPTTYCLRKTSRSCWSKLPKGNLMQFWCHPHVALGVVLRGRTHTDLVRYAHIWSPGAFLGWRAIACKRWRILIQWSGYAFKSYSCWRRKTLLRHFCLSAPENLGAVSSFKRKARKAWFQTISSQVRPASIWQLQELQRFVNNSKVFSQVFHQCLFGADSPKPTRILTCLPYLKSLGWTGWPQLHPQTGAYLGPLPFQCACAFPHRQLISKGSDGSFLTTAAAAYPPRLDELFATAVSEWITSLHRLKRVDTLAAEVVNSSSSEIKNDLVSQNALVLKNDLVSQNDLVLKNDSVSKNDLVSKNDPVTQDDSAVKNDMVKERIADGGVKRSQAAKPTLEGTSKKVPRRAQLEVWYKGRFRRAADGLGKCSQGIRPPSARRRSLEKGAVGLASAFWKEVESFINAMTKQERLRTIASLALGKYESSPFGGKVQQMRKRLDEIVVALGKKPGRREGDRDTEIQFRRLKAWAELVEDEDHSYLHGLAARGVPVGARGEIGKIGEVYDSKTKGEPEGSLPAWEEDFQGSDRDNYRSATEHLDKVKLHIEEDIKKGWIVEMSREEAERRFGDELQIASLGAAPKDQQWSDVRVVHDGTHGIQVNSRISQPNRMEFPQFDDLQSVMRSFQLDEPSPKMLCAFDIKSAHRLIPVQPEDWGLLAFRLEEGGPIYCNTVGTFGVASASFWWGRVSGTLFRVLHKVLPREALMYLMLFADDGLILAGGEDYHRFIIGTFIFLEIMEVPLSWKKTRGGLATEWIGYTVDLNSWTIGISPRKVSWLQEWVRTTNLEGKILGRDFRAGVGRMGFLAGAIKGARPFLAPLYALSARMGNTTFTELPMAVRISLEFFAEWLAMEPMRPLADPPGVAGEVFRVDAMASDKGIRVGGWETFHTTEPSKARWFSVEITRENCPWLYVRGEPHRTIAASELLAVTLAVMLFGPDSHWHSKHGRLVLSGFTDNSSNAHLIDKYLSVKFPVSLVLMELSRQLADMRSELQLHWIPREQNDDLSKGKLEAFDPSNQIVVDFSTIKFKVIPKLMEHAMAFDKEIQLRKSSKELAKQQTSLSLGKTPPSEKLRLRQPWWLKWGWTMESACSKQSKSPCCETCEIRWSGA